MEIHQVFKRILKSLGCYSEYVCNYKRLPRYIEELNKSQNFKQFIEDVRNFRKGEEGLFSYFINDSFDWSLTPQGHEYWSNINQEFRTIYRIRKRFVGYDEENTLLDEETKKMVFNII